MEGWLYNCHEASEILASQEAIDVCMCMRVRCRFGVHVGALMAVCPHGAHSWQSVRAGWLAATCCVFHGRVPIGHCLSHAQVRVCVLISLDVLHFGCLLLKLLFVLACQWDVLVRKYQGLNCQWFDKGRE